MPKLAVVGEGLAELRFETTREVAGTAALTVAPGGDAGNLAVMAARFGAEVRIGGRVGNDPFGDELLRFWDAAGIDTHHVCRDPDAATGLYLNASDGRGGHRFTYWRTGSAGSRLAEDDLGRGFFAGLDLLAATGVTLAVAPAAAASAVDRARSAGARVACVLNHRPALGGDPAALAAFAAVADVVIGSREDAEALFGVVDVHALAAKLPHVAELVLTNGDRPVTAITTGASVIEHPVPRVQAVDAACAGDALAGAYLAQRLAGRPPAEAIGWGVAASARSVTRRGCAMSYPKLAETAELFERLSRAT